MDTTHVAVDGYVDAVPTPGPKDTATFELIVSPANADDAAPDTPDTVLSCTTGDPSITHVLLTEVQPGDLLRVSGTAVQPEGPGEPAHLTIDALEVLTAASPHDLVLDRYGSYCVVFDAETDDVPVFTVDGAWVGVAADPGAIRDLIDTHKQGGHR
jgi:hypothetical protein